MGTARKYSLGMLDLARIRNLLDALFETYGLASSVRCPRPPRPPERKEKRMPRFVDVDEGRATFVPFMSSYPAPPAQVVPLDPKTLRPAPRRPAGIKLGEAEIRKAVADRYPPVLTLEMAAALSGYRASTLKRLLSEGRFRNSAKRGKPVLFWRDRFIQELMQG